MALRIQGMNYSSIFSRDHLICDNRVSSAIVQRYLNQVLEATLSPNSPNQSVAVDVLSFTIKQGLAHPLQVHGFLSKVSKETDVLQSFPVIIALETSPQRHLSDRASALHATLHGKHASLINTRYIISARTSFDYQKKVVSGIVKGEQ
jgi:cohesin loading factor subunit SCC2